ncbi:MAG: cytochrome c [Rhodobacteraceae bacterium]|nr:cytochrome c [Paracoccaceae bacterium]
MSLATLIFCLGFTQVIAENVNLGHETFMDHCAVCHGETAKGDGPMHSVLIIKPSDLTQLSARNEGTFPLVRVIKRIDGRDPLVSHGSPMPVYGDFFDGLDVALKTEAGQPVFTSQPVEHLVDWLKSIQE